MPRARRGRPRRAYFLIDARVSTAVARKSGAAVGTTDGRPDAQITMNEAPTRAFVRRALERVVDASGRAEFAIRACDGTLAPHAFDGSLRRMGEAGTSTSAGGFTFGKFYASSATCVRDGLTAFERVETAYEEAGVGDDASTATVARGVSLKEWLVNLTRNIGAATNDFADISGFGSSFGMDDEHAEDGDADDYNVLFILSPLPRVSDEEVKQLDGAQVLKSFRGVEEQFKKDKIKAHLLFVGEKPRDAFAEILREVFRNLNGTVFPLDAACRLAPWVPLFDTLESYGDAVGKDDQTKTLSTLDRSTSTVDILVQTKEKGGLRLGEAHQVGASGRRDVTLSIVGFVNKADVPATSLALESQTIMSFSDSPIRALLAMLVMKDAVCAVRREAGQSNQMAILTPLTCASFTITSLKADAVRPDHDATEDSLQHEMDDLLSRRSNLETLESITGLLEKLRDDLRAKIVSPAATQELALAQTSGSLSQREYHDDVFHAPSSQDVRTLEDAFDADRYRGASQSASRLEAWYGTQDLTPAVRKVLRSMENEICVNSRDGEIARMDTRKVLDERFRKMMKVQNGIVSPPRKSKARRSLGATLNEFALLGDVERWAGSADEVVNAAKLQYDEFVATLSDEPNGIDPNLHEFAAKTLHRLRLSLGDIDMDELFERLTRATVIDAKTLKLKYVKNKCKAAKRREYVLQAHVSLRIALIKMELMRDVGSSEDPEALEGRVMDKKDMKKLVKSVNKLIDEIRFILTPADRAGVIALMENDFAPNYTGLLPETMRLLKIELGVSDDAMPERASDSLALTPFSPPPPRRSPRKPKQPDRFTYDDVKQLPPPVGGGGGKQKKPPPPKEWHWLARSNSRRAITLAVQVKGNAAASFAPPKPKVSRGSTARHAYPMATPLPRAGRAVASTPAMTRPMVSRIGETPATRPRSSGIIAETPVGTQLGPPARRGGGAVLSTPISGCDISRTLQFSAATPRPTKRTNNAGLHSPDPKKSRLGS